MTESLSQEVSKSIVSEKKSSQSTCERRGQNTKVGVEYNNSCFKNSRRVNEDKDSPQTERVEVQLKSGM